jgi:hypothetical protein
MNELLFEKDVKTRTEHHCYFCGRNFKKGTTMHKITIVDDYGILDIYTCLTCEKLKDKYPEYCFDEIDNVYIEGSVRELLKVEFPDCETPEDILKLST